MRKTLINKVFLFCLMLAIINQTLEKVFGIFIPFIHSYLDDVLCFPIVLTFGLAVYRAADKQYILKPPHLVITFVVYSVYFEWYLPQVSDTATSDAWDLLAYAIGLTIYGYFINKTDDVGLEPSI